LNGNERDEVGAHDSFRSCDLTGDAAMATHTDPVCGEKIDDQKTTSQAIYQGNGCYFCSEGRKTKFDKHPQ
jgi:YHS domain-containing protein